MLAFVRGILLLCLGTTLVACSTSGLDSIQITPATLSLAAGQTGQFSAVGTYGNGQHLSTRDLTTGVTWSSTTPSVASVNAAGLVTAVATGTTTITASATGYSGPISSSAILTVTSVGGGTTDGLISLTIIPSTISVPYLQDTGQFLAIGTFSTAPTVRDLTNSPALTWISDKPNVFPVNTNTAGSLGATAGIVSAYGSGLAAITAEARSGDGSLQTATATFSCPLVNPGICTTAPGSPLLATLTVYNEGLNTTNWLIIAPSASGTLNVIQCGPGAPDGKSVCVATYPIGTQVTLTAPATGAQFGGWSSNCTNQIPAIPSPAGPNSCTVTLTTNDTVGAIFN